MYFFTSDEHYGHDKVREYTHRPFFTWQEMDEELIRRHNSKSALQKLSLNLVAA